MSIPRACFFALFALSFSLSSYAKVAVSDPTLGFSFELPVGFAPTPDTAKTTPPGIDPADILQSYTRPAPGKLPSTIVIVSRLHHTLGDAPTTGLPADADLESWHTFKLPVSRSIDASHAIFTVQLPLAPEAIQLTIIGPPNQEKRDRGLVKTILASLTGPSTWDTPATSPKPAPTTPSRSTPSANSSSSPRPAGTLSPEQRGERIAYGVMALCACIGVAAALLLHSTRQKILAAASNPAADPLRNLTPARARMIGLGCLLGSALAVYWCILQPLDEAANHKSSLSLTHSGVVIVPMLIGCGIILLINGNRRWIEPHSANKIGKIIATTLFASLLIAGIALDIWFRAKLRSMGYNT